MITLPLGSLRPCDERGGSGLHARCPSLAKRSEGDLRVCGPRRKRKGFVRHQPGLAGSSRCARFLHSA